MSMTLAGILTNHLTARRWTFERLAHETTLPRNTVYQWTRGNVRRVHRWKHLVKIAAAFHVDLAQTVAPFMAGGSSMTHLWLKTWLIHADGTRIRREEALLRSLQYPTTEEE